MKSTKDKVITVTEASRNFSELVNLVRYRGESATLTKNGHAVARLVPVGPPLITGAQLAKRWKAGQFLTPKEADAMWRDMQKGKKIFKPYVSPWD